MALWRWGRWRIELEANGVGNPCLGVYGDPHGRSVVDHPIRWPDGRVAYDRPEALPNRVKAAVARFMLACVDTIVEEVGI